MPVWRTETTDRAPVWRKETNDVAPVWGVSEPLHGAQERRIVRLSSTQVRVLVRERAARARVTEPLGGAQVWERLHGARKRRTECLRLAHRRV